VTGALGTGATGTTAPGLTPPPSTISPGVGASPTPFGSTTTDSFGGPGSPTLGTIGNFNGTRPSPTSPFPSASPSSNPAPFGSTITPSGSAPGVLSVPGSTVPGR